ncbi:energy-coupling factor transporter transmembrane component T [Erysipelothrix rhusiopathiae]|uniref:energy-coupling factor transporter transmembrane component T family protein n=1 Tax=Erysipelothrix rhusiopathiae TaxID=1648 RepID=UPI000F438C47|nr:energy-coupling factor transporter transmembrane component T [Erysipelothrix rhusiopathiae]AYV34362.1 energy-coupling factor transporter transmembrane protein EcfT [Erysipelothrix rhusiopathiae]MDE8081724.1 energy-coupling factor transporter transmembrane component T [Erysipelothrix rhusiopathiae]MDE8314995.1 energy-coupling factor transporter transmembrane component T [Erysipelothrix rhusiopathiae]MDE8329193.1 energy-coupling factor transporter transmembrane component T [Erysipelothrix rhus
MNDIALGRYVPLDSKIHKLDPRIKIIAMLVLMVSIFMVKNVWANVFLFFFFVCAILASKLTFKFILKSIKPMLFMLVFLFVMNMFLIREGTLLVQFAFFKIYSGALYQTAFIVTRLVLMIMVTTLLTATTAPLDLTLGIEDLLNPLKKIGVPSHEIAMMISIALRFIPTLIEDTQRIMDAQASRGVDLKEGSFKEKINGAISMLIPLFVSIYHRAEDLADAMEARGYYPGKTRTRYKQLKIRFSDWFMLFLCVAVLIAVIGLGRL